MEQTNRVPDRELALGWRTYGVGDQMSHYAVSASVPKTLITHLINTAKKLGFSFAMAAFGLAAQSTSSTGSPSVPSYSAGPKEELSRLAGRVLNDTNQARTALKKGDHSLAVTDVKHAETDLARLDALAHGATAIPVYQEFVSISILSPSSQEQNKPNQGGTAAHASSGNAAVHEVAGSYTRVTLNTAQAKNGLDAAQTALDQGQWTAADSALASVQKSVQKESAKSDIPLSQARENLILARAAIRQNRYTQAKAALQSASRALSQYEAAGGPHAGEAKNLQQQIDRLASNPEQSGDAVAQINHWWNITSGWSPYQSAASSTRH